MGEKTDNFVVVEIDRDRIMLEMQGSMESIIKHFQSLSGQIEEKTGKIIDAEEFRKDFYQFVQEFRLVKITVDKMSVIMLDGDRSHATRITVLEERDRAIEKHGSHEQSLKANVAMWISISIAIASAVTALFALFRQP